MSNAKQERLISYYRNITEHLRHVLNVQRERCLKSGQDVHDQQMDLDFYVITVRRVFELFKMGKSVSRLETTELTDYFKNRWPHLTDHRNSVLHIIAPSPGEDIPQYIGGQFIATFRAGGELKYIIDPRHHHEEVIGLLDKFAGIIDEHRR
jgi:hypothetical protein